ncbi:MAG: hypothetical protein ACOC1F_09695 [Myxococcota bacterium]
MACGGSAPPNAPEKGWTPGLEQLIPAGVDLVARIDWKRAREAGVNEPALEALRDAGVSAAVLDTLAGCLGKAEFVRIGIRLGPNGLDGDTMAVITGLPSAREPDDVPCGAQGWEHSGTRRELDVFEPDVPSTDRSSAAMMLRSRKGAVAVVTPGQVDGLLRVLRNGPDAGRLDPTGDGVVVIEARIQHAMLPMAWKARAPVLVEAAEGLLEERIRVQVRGDRIEIRAALTYADAARAEQAGEKLREVRTVLLDSGRDAYGQVAESMHASLQGDLLRLELAIPRGGASQLVPGTKRRDEE